MLKPKTKRSTRIRNMITISALTAVILTTATYAWFIGMQSVNVTSFDVEIKSTDSLLLSLDGKKWSPELTISETDLPNLAYAGNTNNWGKLIPMSTIGEMDVEASRVMLYEKASFTATPGGYRLMASRVRNYDVDDSDTIDVDETEQDGYVAFDLFIHNFSGRQYIEDLDIKDEEGIYLTTDSKAEVRDNDSVPSGTGVIGTGIENSIRVAFAQIGRVNGTTIDQSKITGITCNGVKDADTQVWTPLDGADVNGVTGICRIDKIWEPNDTAHVQAAIDWYDTACLTRTGDDLTKPASYGITNPGDLGTKCNTANPVVDDTAYDTYAISKPITSGNRVDVYDGYYNGYTKSIDDGYLTKVDYFTDTMRDKTGTARPEIMWLAPNSVTKVRVYIYIEGQDIDNFDFSSIGKTISIAFGFTKERFRTTNNPNSDTNYDGPPIDTTRPVITLANGSDKTVEVGDLWSTTNTAIGATALDNIDGDITSDIVVNTSDLNLDSGGLIQAAPGVYYVTYDVMDATGNHSAQKVVKVTVDPAS